MTDGQPSEFDLAVETVVESLVRESQELQPGGCCLDPGWRGLLCQYHQGYEDGAERALRLTGVPQDPPAGGAPTREDGGAKVERARRSGSAADAPTEASANPPAGTDPHTGEKMDL
jgi:hypothetical protein